jgi:transcriptional regulator with XRE-family HTH domain
MAYSYHFINHESSGSASRLMQQLRVATNLNASGLAEQMKVAPSTVTRIIHGQVCPSYDDMLHYAYCLGFTVEENNLTRSKHLRDFKSPKEIGDLVNAELEKGLDSESLQFILRTIPKLTLDWSKLSYADQKVLMVQPSSIQDIRFQALVEGAVRFYAHEQLWEDPPEWTNKTRLKKQFVPRAAIREIGKHWYARIEERVSLDFLEKNILFSYREMQVI